MKTRKDERFEMTELWLVKADWDRTFIGSIKRLEDNDGFIQVFGEVTVNEGKIVASANTEEDLTNKLNDICTMKLDHGLHDKIGTTTLIFEDLFFHN